MREEAVWIVLVTLTGLVFIFAYITSPLNQQEIDYYLDSQYSSQKNEQI